MRRFILGLIVVTLSFSALTAQSDPLAECVSQGITPAPLVVGERGQVSSGDANNVRDLPTRSGALIGTIPGLEMFTVLDGPVCADSLAWWQVDYNGLIGWTVDGAGGEQWLFPVPPEPGPESIDPIDQAAEGAETAAPAYVPYGAEITPENVGSLQTVWEIACPPASNQVLISADNRYIAAPCYSDDFSMREVRVYDVITQDLMAALTVPDDGVVRTLAFVQDGLLVEINRQNRPTSVITTLEFVTGDVSTDTLEMRAEKLIVSTDQTAMLAYTFDDLMITGYSLIDIATFETVQSGDFAQPINPSSLAFSALSHDLTRLVTAVEENTDPTANLILSIIDLATGDVLVERTTSVNASIAVLSFVGSVAFSPSGNFVLLSGCLNVDFSFPGGNCVQDGVLWFSTVDGSEAARWTEPNGYLLLNTLQFSPSRDLMLGTKSLSFSVFNVDSGAEVLRMGERSGRAAISPDGTYIAFADGDFLRLLAVPAT
jgi:hypothetical protein